MVRAATTSPAAMNCSPRFTKSLISSGSSTRVHLLAGAAPAALGCTIATASSSDDLAGRNGSVRSEAISLWANVPPSSSRVVVSQGSCWTVGAGGTSMIGPVAIRAPGGGSEDGPQPLLAGAAWAPAALGCTIATASSSDDLAGRNGSVRSEAISLWANVPPPSSSRVVVGQGSCWTVDAGGTSMIGPVAICAPGGGSEDGRQPPAPM